MIIISIMEASTECADRQSAGAFLNPKVDAASLILAKLLNNV